ncbi:MAG TPA: hypothetical protein VM866_11200 [Pyrinomonadaceae bacterium]|jgi:hypothetical protein|nr:hypothetical protein [Pyrinomonadaceae bacterium]
MKRRIEIILETEQFFFIRGNTPRRLRWCEKCASDVEMMRPEEASLVSRQNRRAIYRGVEAGRVHFTETPEGLLLVCMDSVRASHEK